MSRQRLNLLVRIVLALTVGVTLVLTVVSAKPGYRGLGTYTAAILTAQPILDLYNQAAVYVTISHPALVSLPPEWHLADQICMVVRLRRGPAPTAIEFSDWAPQTQWDKIPEDAVLFGPDNIVGMDREGGQFAITNIPIAAQFSVRMPYRVRWIGHEYAVVKDEIGGLLCYSFFVTTNEERLTRTPLYHRLNFTVKNVNVTRQPRFTFRYNSEVAKNDPAGTLRLEQIALDTYLSRLLVEAPFAVTLMTISQSEKRATEIASQR